MPTTPRKAANTIIDVRAHGQLDWGLDPDDAVLYDGETGGSRAVKAARGDQRGYYLALREALHGQAPNPVPPQQGATVMSIIEAALHSEADGRRVVPDLTANERAAWRQGLTSTSPLRPAE